MRTPIRWALNASSLGLCAIALLVGGCDDSDDGGKLGADERRAASSLEEVVETRSGLTIRKHVRRLPDGGTVDHGRCVMTYADGTKAGEGRYEEGQTAGIWRGWHPNGQLSMEGKYVFGKKEGKWTWWDNEGRISRQARYTQGLEVEGPAEETATRPAESLLRDPNENRPAEIVAPPGTAPPAP